MTLQVALIANNGWIMASDTKESRSIGNGIGSQAVRESAHRRRITYDRLSDTTYIVPGDASRAAARDIVKALRTFRIKCVDENWLENELPKIANARWRKNEADGRPQSPRKIVLAVQNCCPFWEVRIDEESTAERIYSSVFSGEDTNSARYFIEEYYDREYSVRELLPLVGHTILMGALRNPSGVGGLEIAFLEDGILVDWGFRSPELKRLNRHSRELREFISKRLLNGDLIV